MIGWVHFAATSWAALAAAPALSPTERCAEWVALRFIDPVEPGDYRTELVHQYLDTFLIDLDGDQILDPLFDLTFILRTASGSKTMWLRNRSFVGRRVLEPRRPRGRRAPE